MSDGLDDLLDDNIQTDPGQGGKGLRTQLERVLAENAALQERLAKTEQVQRDRSVADLFSKHQIPDLAKDLFPKDAEPTDEAATALVEKYGALWGAQAATATTTPAQQAATTAAQQFASQAAQPPVAPMSEDEFRAKFGETQTKEDLLRQIDAFEQTALVQLME